MQLRRGWLPAAIAAGLCAAPAGPAGAASLLDEQTAGSLLQLFTDSGHVAVRTAIQEYSVTLPRGTSLDLHWNNERVVVPAIQAPPGSQAAVDAITTASRPISGNGAYRDYVKVRNEFQGQAKQRHAELGYYYSTEPDYLAQQVTASVNRDVAGDQLNLELGTSLDWDAIAPLADDDTRTGAASKRTLHWNAVATRIVSPTTQVRLGVELNLVDGLQHNPYRNVYAGGARIPERHPGHRERRDAFLRIHQYFANRSSLKLAYRFYDDDWGIDSHEVGSTLSQYVTRGLYATWDYRWYTQTGADFYRSEYATPDGVNGYRTGDYRMAALSSHLFGASLDMDLGALEVPNPWLARLGMRWGYQRYFNSNNYSANFLTAQLTCRF